MNKFFTFSIAGLVLAILGTFTFFMVCDITRVKAGNVGVLVHNFGGQKGVDTEVKGVGRYIIGWNEEMHIFPTFTQNIVYEGENAVRFNDRDGLLLASNVNAAYNIPKSNVSTVFQKYRAGVEEISDVVLRREIEKAFNDVASRYAASVIYGEGRTTFTSEVLQQVQRRVRGYGINVETVNMVGEMALPPAVKQAITAKIQATQLTIQRQNEVAQTIAEANKAREKAKGSADAITTLATAEANALDIKGAALARNPNVIEYTKATRWDGVLPRVTGGTVPFMDVDKQ